MTDIEIIHRWKWSEQNQRSLRAISQISKRPLLDIIHLLNTWGLTKGGWTNGKAEVIRCKKSGSMQTL